ncbi:DUF401 family protein [bacterium]|nr:DUF401 family protein [bacterium]
MEHLPLLAKLGIIFGVIILVMIFRLPTFVPILLGAIVTGILFTMPAFDIARTFLDSVIDFYTIDTILIVCFIEILGKMMKERGILSRFAGGADYLLRGSRVSVVTIPMFVGLLPMPGGAYFTAPMTEEQIKPYGIKPGLAVYINYWFRHVWEYFWPLYPGLIVGFAIIKNLTVGSVIVHQSFVTLLAIAAGAVILFAFVKRRDVRPERLPGKGSSSTKDVLYGAFPLMIIVVLIAITQALGSIIKIPVSAVMLVVLVSSWIFYKVPLKGSGKLILSALDWRVISLMASVMFFKYMLDRSSALAGLGPMLSGAPSSLIVAMIMFLPFVVGLLVGLNQAYVATTFPLLAPFIGHDPGLVMLAYAFGFFGVMLSPSHLCLALSREYFRASWGSVYKWLVPSVIAVAIVTFAVWLLLFQHPNR